MKLVLSKIWIIALTGLLFMILIFGAWGYFALVVPVNLGMPQSTKIQIQEGEGVHVIAQKLANQNLIRSSFWFKVAVKIKRKTLQAGTYFFAPSESALDILEALANGKLSEVILTFPEGWRMEEIFFKLNQANLIKSKSDFVAAIRAKNFSTLQNRFQLQDTQIIEGMMFPDTYRFAVQSTPAQIVQKFIDNFLIKIQGLTLDYDTLIIASIVEREAKLNEDRAKIAGVYWNRLRVGMKLDADPTVQYAKANQVNGQCRLSQSAWLILIPRAQATSTVDCGITTEWWPKLVAGDTKNIQSPYNTYLRQGLPPTPIANPGLASIQAAANPADHDFFYFVTDKKNKAHFAKTFAEQQENIRRFLP